MQPFFSIVVPTYSRPKQLATCLQALTRLNYPRDRFEVIIVDDGSETPLKTVIALFCKQMNVKLISQANAGPAMARNTGAARAKGEYLAFTDDDCIVAPDWLKFLAARFVNTPDHLIGGRTLNNLPNNPYSTTSQLIVDIVYRQYNADPNKASFFASNNLAIATHLFHYVGGFDSSFRTSEDREFCERWLSYGFQMIYVQEAVIYHAHHLNFRTFCQQHFNYGRGAHRFHYKLKRCGRERFWVETKFHFNLHNWLFYPFSHVKGHRTLYLAALMFDWQVINAAGFLWEAMKQAFHWHRK